MVHDLCDHLDRLRNIYPFSSVVFAVGDILVAQTISEALRRFPDDKHVAITMTIRRDALRSQLVNGALCYLSERSISGDLLIMTPTVRFNFESLRKVMYSMSGDQIACVSLPAMSSLSSCVPDRLNILAEEAILDLLTPFQMGEVAPPDYDEHIDTLAFLCQRDAMLWGSFPLTRTGGFDPGADHPGLAKVIQILRTPDLSSMRCHILRYTDYKFEGMDEFEFARHVHDCRENAKDTLITYAKNTRTFTPDFDFFF
jgi:hypothetical protein